MPVGQHTAPGQRFGMESRTRVSADPSGVGCPAGECPWYSRDREKTGTGYRTKDETMRAVGLFTHGGPEVLQVVELPEVPRSRRRRVLIAGIPPSNSSISTATPGTVPHRYQLSPP